MHKRQYIMTSSSSLLNVNTAFVDLAVILPPSNEGYYRVSACFESNNSRMSVYSVREILYQIYSTFEGVKSQGQGYISSIHPETSYNACTLTAVVFIPLYPINTHKVQLRCVSSSDNVVQARVLYTLERLDVWQGGIV